MENNEQWLAEGNCTKCRRKNYCGKTCSAAKHSLYKSMQNALLNTEAGRALMSMQAEMTKNQEQ